MAIKSKACEEKNPQDITWQTDENNTLEGRLERNDYEDEEVFGFLKFLNIANQPNAQELTPSSKEDWIKVVKKYNKRSISSLFLKQELHNS